MGWYERWARWSERYRFLMDLALTVLCTLIVVVTAGDAGPYYLTSIEAALISAAVVAPLAWCRTRPVSSCIAVFVACMVQMIGFSVSLLLPANLAVLVSMYCITVYGPRWAYLMACGMAVVGPLTLGALMWFRIDASYAADPAPTIGMVVLVMTLLACSFAFGLVRRSRRTMLVAMRERAERLEIERDQQAQIATAAERSRIAREMHDIVAHSLSVVIAQADGGRYAAASDLAAAERTLGTIAETGRAALADMRRLLGVLREDQPSATTPLGLVAPDAAPRRGTTATRAPSGANRGGLVAGAGGTGATRPATAPPSGGAAPLRPQPDTGDISSLVEQARADGLRVSWARVGVERRLPPGVGLTLYRVCQEALTNVRKHAGPRPAVTVLLRWGEGEVELRVEDDGRGLAADDSSGPDDPVPTAGYGLLGMRERAEMFGGTLTAGPRRGGGFSVRFVVPIPRASTVVSNTSPDTMPAAVSDTMPDAVPDAAPYDLRDDEPKHIAGSGGPGASPGPRAGHTGPTNHADQNDTRGAR
ncbi:sensor histidine kinase [Promicromonospora iranensis]|uniref:histidine kinase n=1 Tax=Promicromonospora iranensis TaxID=1105144 RepID=A0ABU2CRT5_9MICO|nr:sensor histidine kinase [Promicromonospora iranensis]MDR7384055.1 signal transduction histidine kinase [Promicromonospora iranensis]